MSEMCLDEVLLNSKAHHLNVLWADKSGMQRLRSTKASHSNAMTARDQQRKQLPCQYVAHFLFTRKAT
jgi:hypothetical protein